MEPRTQIHPQFFSQFFFFIFFFAQVPDATKMAKKREITSHLKKITRHIYVLIQPVNGEHQGSTINDNKYVYTLYNVSN